MHTQHSLQFEAAGHGKHVTPSKNVPELHFGQVPSAKTLDPYLAQERHYNFPFTGAQVAQFDAYGH